MWMLPLYLHVNQKSDYNYDDMSFLISEQKHMLVYSLEGSHQGTSNEYKCFHGEIRTRGPWATGRSPE